MATFKRRVISIPIVCLLLPLCLILTPLVLLYSLVSDLRGGRRALPTFRLWIFAIVFLVHEWGVIPLSLFLWIRGGFGRSLDLPVHSRIEGRWVGSLLRWAGRIFNVSVDWPDLRSIPSGRVVVLSRHSSMIDAVLPAHLFPTQLNRPVRYVMKRELMWVPSIDIFGHRLNNYFVDRSGDTDHEVAAIVKLVEEAEDNAGIVIFPEVVIDLVANHTSFEHPWFRSARTSRTSEYRDHYVWADPGPSGELPNNWVSYFGGPAWTLDEASGQYYLHLFLPEQPDLNWRNEAVRSEFDRIIRFWLERGVDGFRVDVAQGLVKAVGLPSNPRLRAPAPTASREEQWAGFDHQHDILQPESLAIFGRWKRICDEFGAVLIGEVSVADPSAFAAVIDGSGLDIAMWLEPLHVPWDLQELTAVLRGPLDRIADRCAIGWLGSSLDEPRAATRFGGGQIGRQRALALATVMVFLPGIPFLYQGEELGLEQASVAADRRADPVVDSVDTSRDGCRTPIPWSTGSGFGFTDHSSTWLPFGHHLDDDTVAAQTGSPGSCLERHRQLIAARHASVDELTDRPIDWITFDNAELTGFRRGDIAVVLNTGNQSHVVPLAGDVIYQTWSDANSGAGGDAEPTCGTMRIPGPHSIVLRLADPETAS